MSGQSTAQILKFKRLDMDYEDHSELDCGYIKIYRSLQDSSFSNKPEYISAWLHILMLASHKSRKTMLGNSAIRLESGQFISGRKALAKRVGVTEKQMRSILSFFEAEGMIAKSSNRLGTIFTVNNYGIFQKNKGQKGPTVLGQPKGQPEASKHEGYSESGANEKANKGPTERATTQEHNISISNDIDNIYASLSEVDQRKIPTTKPSNDYPIEFEWIWKNRPKREGSDPKRKAFQACTARIKQGATWRELAEGMKRYHHYCETKGTLNTEFVKTMAVFFGPDDHFKNEWLVSSNPKTGNHQGKGPDWDDLTWANDLGGL